MAAQPQESSQYFADLYRLLCDRKSSVDEKVEEAIEIGRRRLDVENGVVTYTGDGSYEILETNISTGKYVPGSVTDLETTWCRHVVDDSEPLAFADANETDYRDDVALKETGEEERQFVDLLARGIGYELERTRHHRELAAQNERLDEFAGTVAHDLRNPLAGATAYLDLALKEASGEQREYLRTVEESLGRMEALIGELLRLARRGADVGRREPIDLADAVDAASESVETEEATLVNEASGTVLAHRSRLRQLLENLFRNAAEHGSASSGTESGDSVEGGPEGVTVTVGDLEDGFYVEDDGPGLPPSIAEALFRPADASGDDETGTGAGPSLGLLIVERIVAGHDWTGSVECDGGTRFEFGRVERR
ncbi:histidine kinase [Halobacteriales archaeon QS_5_70_17]|nr:MAG: histidine kinase [Halobacteriales archaeon QS_5_70_17]